MAASGIAVDEAFRGVRMEPGLRVWRIENFEVVPVPREYYGRFYEGDSYVVFAAHATPSGQVEAHVHFWLGQATSQDEMGTAARKAVELDQHLGDAPTQHREVQGNESDLFLSHFKSVGGVEYLPGGVASGFSHVEPDAYEPALLHIKGKRNVRTTHVPLATSSLNEGDVFILDLGLELFLWSGREANKHEKGKALEVMQRLYDARLSRADGKEVVRVFLDEDPENATFWGALAGDRSEVRGAGEGGEDEAVSRAGPARVFRVSDGGAAAAAAGGALAVEEVPRPEDGRLRREVLDGKDVFLLDTEAVVYVWIGREASEAERRGALAAANAYISQSGASSRARAEVVRQFAEPPAFQALFYQWTAPRAFDFTARASEGVARAASQEEIDFRRLHAVSADSQDLKDEDLADASVRVWRVHDGTAFSEEPAESAGEFFAGDAYVVHSSWTPAGATQPSHLVYFWLGRDADALEKGSAAARAVEVSDSLGKVPQVRVVQGKEPPHFCAAFRGAVIVHQRGHGGALSDEERARPRLFHVKGTRPATTKAVEVEPLAANLNSGDCFVLATPERVSLWCGQGANEAERDVAWNAAQRLAARAGLEASACNEGEEDEAFWEPLGGKTEYPSALPPADVPAFPRLLHVSDLTGALRVEDVPNFAQEDLLDDDVMILDTTAQVFVWVGAKASARERAAALDIAAKYVAAADDGRDPDAVPIIREEAGNESSLFRANFQAWDARAPHVFLDPYEAKLRAAREQEEAKARARHDREAAAAKARADAIAALESKSKEDHDDGHRHEAHEAHHEAHHDHHDHHASPASSAGGAAAGGGGRAAPARTHAPVHAAAATTATPEKAGLTEEEIEAAARVRAAADAHDAATKARLEAAEAERQETLRKLAAKKEAAIKPGEATFSLEELQAALPGGAIDIDFKVKELYLSDADFARVFGVSKADFAGLAGWKQQKLKKDHKLF